jgi:exopolysaccharide production protein ExoZ
MTLNYEMFFYVLVGASLFISRRRNALRLLAAILCILSFSRLFYASGDPILLTYTNPIILEFLAGIIIAELRFRSLLPQVPGAILLSLLGITGFWFSRLHDATDIYRFVWWGGPSLLVVAGMVSLETHNRMIHSTILGALGDASYSIYLCHTFTAKMVLYEFSALPAAAGITAALVVACGLGLFVFRFLERPATTWLRSFANHQGGARSVRSRQGTLVPNPRS